MSPIPPGALPSENTLGMNCLNYEICIKTFEKLTCINLYIFDTHKFLENLILKFDF